MGVLEGRGNLSKSMKDLLQKWADVKGGWDDANSRKFEADFLLMLERDLRTATAAMDHIGQLLNQIRHDCE